MTKKHLLISILFLASASFVYTQKQDLTDKINSTRPNYVARKQINDLKNGVLLVRLKTKSKTISGLKKMGKDSAAERVESDQKDANWEIISALRENFDFCPIHFFYSDYSQEVLDKEFQKVAFLNDSLQPDSSIQFTPEKYLIAEFGIIEQDTAMYYDGSYLQQENGKTKMKKDYYGGADMRFGALIIKSDEFVQLKRPFPYYVRTFDSLPVKRKRNKTVSMMNLKLHEFYNLKR